MESPNNRGDYGRSGRGRIIGTPLGQRGGSRATQRGCRFHSCRDRGVVRRRVLGFTAVIVWERFAEAQTNVEKAANELGDLFRDAQAFPDDVREELQTNLRSYVRLVIEKEWPAMAEGKSSPEAWEAFNQIWQTYYRFRPQNEYERIWYAQSLARLNEFGDQRRLRLLISQSSGIPAVMWAVLVGAGAITIGFSFLFGTKNTVAQALMTGGLAMTIALVLLSIVSMEHPFAGLARVEPEAFKQTKDNLDTWSKPGVGQPR